MKHVVAWTVVRLRRFARARLGIAALHFFAGAPLAAAPDLVVPIALREAPRKVWVEVVPADPSQSTTLRRLEPSARALRLDAGFQGLLCLGGEGMGTVCTRVPPPAAALTEPVSRRVRGRFTEGRQGLRGLSIRVLLPDLDLPRPFALALRLEGDELKREVTTDARGFFELPKMAVGRYVLEATSGEGIVHLTPAFSVVAPGEDAPGEAQEIGPFPFDRGLSVEVTVVDDRGRPVAGALVGAAQDRGGMRPLGGRATDPSGRVRLGGLLDGFRTSLTAQREGYRMARREYPGLPREPVIQMERLSSVSAVVVDDKGSPVSGARVSLAGFRSASSTDRDGRFQIRGVPAGQRLVLIAREGFRSLEVELDVPAGDDADLGSLVLEEGWPLRGSVVDAVTGDAVEGASVSIVRPEGGGSAVTDARGAFVLRTGGKDLVLEARAAGYASHRERISVEGRETEHEVRLPLERPGTLRIECTNDETGEPCAGQHFAVSGPSESRSSMADASGACDLAELAPGDYQVVKETIRSLGGFVTRSGGEEHRSARVLPGQVSLVRFGNELRALRIQAREELPQSTAVRLSGDGWSLRAVRESASSFRGMRRRAEPFRIWIDEEGRGSCLRASLPGYFDRDEVVIAAGGRVRASAKPTSRVEILDATGSRAGVAISSPTGEVDLGCLAPGSYTIPGKEPRSFSVSPGQTVELGPLAP